MKEKWSTLEEKLAWLRERPELWKEAAEHPEDLYNLRKPIVRAMKAAKLLAPTTYSLDVNIRGYLRLLVAEKETRKV